jgi:hypothetical protein
MLPIETEVVTHSIVLPRADVQKLKCRAEQKARQAARPADRSKFVICARLLAQHLRDRGDKIPLVNSGNFFAWLAGDVADPVIAFKIGLQLSLEPCLERKGDEDVSARTQSR